MHFFLHKTRLYKKLMYLTIYIFVLPAEASYINVLDKIKVIKIYFGEFK